VRNPRAELSEWKLKRRHSLQSSRFFQEKRKGLDVGSYSGTCRERGPKARKKVEKGGTPHWLGGMPDGNAGLIRKPKGATERTAGNVGVWDMFSDKPIDIPNLSKTNETEA